MSARIAIEINAGTSIEHASMDAQRVATLLGINCEFSFNDVKCLASPNGDYLLLARARA